MQLQYIVTFTFNVPYARNYKPQLVYFLPIFHFGLHCRAVYNVERLIFHVFFSSYIYKDAIQVARKVEQSILLFFCTWYVISMYIKEHIERRHSEPFKFLYLPNKYRTFKYIATYLNQGPLITDGRSRNEIIFSKISLARMTWHFKSNEDIITKF